MRFHATLSLLLIVAAAIGINAMPPGSALTPKHRVRDLRVRNPFAFKEAPALEGAANGAAEA